MLKEQFIKWYTLQQAISELQGSKAVEGESKQCEAALNYTWASLSAIARELKREWKKMGSKEKEDRRAHICYQL